MQPGGKTDRGRRWQLGVAQGAGQAQAVAAEVGEGNVDGAVVAVAASGFVLRVDNEVAAGVHRRRAGSSLEDGQPSGHQHKQPCHNQCAKHCTCRREDR